MRLCVILYIRLFLSAWSLRFLRSLREKHKTIFYTPKTSSCCYILFLFALGNGNCPVKFLLFFRTRISRITRTAGRASQSLWGGNLLIAYEPKVAQAIASEYHPDGIRVIRLWLRNIHPAWRLTCATFGSCSPKHRKSRFFGWISLIGLVWGQRSIKQRVIYIYRTAIKKKEGGCDQHVTTSFLKTMFIQMLLESWRQYPAFPRARAGVFRGGSPYRLPSGGEWGGCVRELLQVRAQPYLLSCKEMPFW